VLASGDRLVATARDPRRLEDLVEKYGDQVRTARLDVADEDTAYAAVQVAVVAFGRLDAVVNNAGYGDIAPFEQVSPERFKALVDTNFYGVVNMTRAALPTMRKQKSGCILQISSVGGRLALPGSLGGEQQEGKRLLQIQANNGIDAYRRKNRSTVSASMRSKIVRRGLVYLKPRPRLAGPRSTAQACRGTSLFRRKCVGTVMCGFAGFRSDRSERLRAV